MDHLGLIAGLLMVVIVAVIIGFNAYKHKKNTGETVSFDEFIDEYGQQIVSVLVDVMQLLKLDNGDYEDRDEYEYTVISMTIDKLKENSVELGIDSNVISMINTDGLTNIVQKVLHNELMEIFNESMKCVNIGYEVVDEGESDEEEPTEPEIPDEEPESTDPEVVEDTSDENTDN